MSGVTGQFSFKLLIAGDSFFSITYNSIKTTKIESYTQFSLEHAIHNYGRQISLTFNRKGVQRMKKYKLGLAVLLMLGLALSAAAAEFGFHGDMNNRFLLYSNHTDWLNTVSYTHLTLPTILLV